MTKFKHVLMLALLATGTALATPAAAVTLVDTGMPVGGGAPTDGWVLMRTQTLAGLFTLGAAATITSVEGFINGFAGNGTISIFTGAVDPASATLEHSAGFTIAASSLGTWQGVFGRSWNLAAGQHWVVFTSDFSNVMTFRPPNPLSQNAFAPALTGPWTQFGSRNGIGVRITGNPTAVIEPPGPGAVPEPGTWAMMLIGFGVVGGALRARRRAVKVSHA